MKLIYSTASQSGQFEREGVTAKVSEALTLSFPFDSLVYDPVRGQAFCTYGPARKALTEAQRAEVEAVILTIAPPAGKTLAQVKREIREKFNLLRESAFAAGVAYEGATIDTDPASVQKINGAVTMALIAVGNAQPFSINWTTANDTSITLDANQMIMLGLTVGMQADALHQRTRQAKDALALATTIAEAEAVVW